MKNLLLAAATVFAIGTGAAFADGNGYAQPAEAIHAAAVADPVHRVFATTSHSEVWIYPAFRSEGYAQGGES